MHKEQTNRQTFFFIYIDSITTNADRYPGNATPKEISYQAPEIKIGPQETQRCRQIKELYYACLQGSKGIKGKHKPMQLNVSSLSAIF
jgi:hypothetical protein